MANPVFKCLTDASCRDGGGMVNALAEAGIVLAQAAVSAAMFAVAGPLAAAVSSSLLGAILGNFIGGETISNHVTKAELQAKLEKLKNDLRKEMQTLVQRGLSQKVANDLQTAYLTHADKVGDFMFHVKLAHNTSQIHKSSDIANLKYCIADYTLLNLVKDSVDKIVNTFEANHAMFKSDTRVVRFGLAKIGAAIGAYTTVVMNSVALCYREKETLHTVLTYEERMGQWQSKLGGWYDEHNKDFANGLHWQVEEKPRGYCFNKEAVIDAHCSAHQTGKSYGQCWRDQRGHDSACNWASKGSTQDQMCCSHLQVVDHNGGAPLLHPTFRPDPNRCWYNDDEEVMTDNFGRNWRDRSEMSGSWFDMPRAFTAQWCEGSCEGASADAVWMQATGVQRRSWWMWHHYSGTWGANPYVYCGQDGRSEQDLAWNDLPWGYAWYRRNGADQTSSWSRNEKTRQAFRRPFGSAKRFIMSSSNVNLLNSLQPAMFTFDAVAVYEKARQSNGTASWFEKMERRVANLEAQHREDEAQHEEDQRRFESIEAKLQKLTGKRRLMQLSAPPEANRKAKPPCLDAKREHRPHLLPGRLR